MRQKYLGLLTRAGRRSAGLSVTSVSSLALRAPSVPLPSWKESNEAFEACSDVGSLSWFTFYELRDSERALVNGSSFPHPTDHRDVLRKSGEPLALTVGITDFAACEMRSSRSTLPHSASFHLQGKQRQSALLLDRVLQALLISNLKSDMTSDLRLPKRSIRANAHLQGHCPLVF